MPHLRIRKIMDELNLLGMTPAHHVLITELVATCLLAAGPKQHEPLSGAERTRLWRERKSGNRDECDDVTSHVTTSAIDNNIISITKNNNTTPPVTKSVTTSRGTRLPDDWNPSECLWSWGKEKLSEADLRFETAAMRDFFQAQSGQRGVKLDWGKTWKTWIREAKRRRDRFKPKADKVVSFTPSPPQRTYAEIRAEREQKREVE
jgi:hypothetical protein